MLNSFRRWLISLNHTSGRSWWWLVATLGMLIIVSWIAAIIPFLCAFNPFIHIEWIGRWSDQGLGITAYNTWTIMDPFASQLFVILFFCIALVKVGLLLWNIGSNFGSGCIYHLPCIGSPSGHFAKRR